jgi:eIF-2B alpha/beta/delta-like uncharacterized protein
MTSYHKITSLIDEIRNDRVHGASQLAQQAAQVLKTAAEHSQAKSVAQLLAEQILAGNELMSARPAMAPVYNMVSRLLKTISARATEMELPSFRQLVMTRADEAVNDSLQAVNLIARLGAGLITGGDKIMTHSYSATVIATLKAAHARYDDIEVIATRSGAGRTGEKMAAELADHGIHVTFIDDTATGLYLPAINKVMVGADRICADGRLVNGIGTYPVALAAERAGIPFYVLCEALKFDPRLRGDEVDLEEKETSEVVEPGRLPPEVIVKNPYFDITPPELIKGIVTENGVFLPEEISAYMKQNSDLD